MTPPIVTVVVPTRNEERSIRQVLRSIRCQSYPAIEIIVVDNASTDQTCLIAREYTSRVYVRGPERSAQRNFGAQQASGDYLIFVDADMELTPNVVAECVTLGERHPDIRAVIIPEASFGTNFWARCKALERSCYLGDQTIEAARFFRREFFLASGGYDESLLGGEDWDVSQRLAGDRGLGRIESVIRHNEGQLSLFRTMRKKRYYATTYAHYASRHGRTALLQGNMLLRPAFLRAWRRLLRHPVLLVGMVVMKSCEMLAATVGFVEGTWRLRRQRQPSVPRR